MPARKATDAAKKSTASTRSSRSRKSSPPPDVEAGTETTGILDTVSNAVHTVTDLVSDVVETVSDNFHAAQRALSDFESAEIPSVEAMTDAVEDVVERVQDLTGTIGNDVARGTEPTPVEKDEKKTTAKGNGKGKEVETEIESTEVPKKAALTMEERQQKMRELRKKMNASTAANRKDLITEHQRNKTTARELASLEKKRRLAETLREQADAEELGEDTERNKNWSYSIEDNDRWEKKLEEKRAQTNDGFVDNAHSAHRVYEKATASLKPDLQTYNYQREQALGLPAGTLTHPNTSSSKVLARMKPMTSDDLYRDANGLNYADNKPSEDAVDRVVQNLNKTMELRKNNSRKRANDEDGDVTYINDANKVFNKKINRYYDKYTKEIRANFERGTAL
ncbi:Cyclin D-interacting protein GCIP [Phaffia rhodozyma]|uniref:Pre-mRNA-splicing factor SYF2 n=1 Tax=Phaffia rhodozyma TaxID=264483 RepID=A0A0F7SIL9_PHARH|nr:Cyclin D-interacting protein GCIP [Phaffia rhodozyma]